MRERQRVHSVRIQGKPVKIYPMTLNFLVACEERESGEKNKENRKRKTLYMGVQGPLSDLGESSFRGLYCDEGGNK